MPFLELESPRLFLRPLDESDAPVINAIFGDPEAVRFVGDGKHDESMEASQQRLSDLLLRRHQPGTCLWWVAVEKSKQEAIGLVILQSMPNDPSLLEVGFHFQQKAWRQGYATEGAIAVIKAAFTVLGERNLVAVTHPENERSIKVLKRVGFSEDGECEYRGRQVKRYAYSVKDDPSPEARARVSS